MFDDGPNILVCDHPSADLTLTVYSAGIAIATQRADFYWIDVEEEWEERHAASY